MNNLKVNMENCYGIKKLQFNFDFSKGRGFNIYAPNGSMKTSFAKTMKSIQYSTNPKDLIYTERVTKLKIEKDGISLLADDIMVIDSYDENYYPKKLSTLMANKNLKSEYDSIHKELEDKKNYIIKKVSNMCGIRNIGEIEKEIINSLKSNDENFFECIEYIADNNQWDSTYSDIKFKTIFNSNVIEFLLSDDAQKFIAEYIEKYNELLEKSKYFKKGVFNHNNANNIGKSLGDNGFFKAKNSVVISGEEIKSKNQLDKIIEREKEQIFNNGDLIMRFEKIDAALNKNNNLREFRELIEKNQDIIPDLKYIDRLKQKFWTSYISENEEEVKEVVSIYKKSKEKIKKIIEKAKNEKSLWQDVVNLFNVRFDVPFNVKIINQQDVILKDEETAVLRFSYKDKNEERNVDKSILLKVLSNGEKRSLYILNIIFEIKALVSEKKEALLIVDDIADSFDYKNKYAIIEYLNDMLKENDFYMIILTHNFDFYRTVGSRLSGMIPRKNCLMTTKSDCEVKLIPGEYIKDIFSKWKDKVNSDDKILIAAIPFVRNLSEYLEGNQSESYLKLTNLLHLKENTNNITVGDLEKIYMNIWRTDGNLQNKNRKIIDILDPQVKEIVKSTLEKVSLENKIILSMKIRLLAEDYMINVLGINVDDSGYSQAGKLFREVKSYRKQSKITEDVYSILEEVNLMTPENIHINSFMYEPILDLSEGHLKRLYNNIYKLLKNSNEVVSKVAAGVEAK